MGLNKTDDIIAPHIWLIILTFMFLSGGGFLAVTFWHLESPTRLCIGFLLAGFLSNLFLMGAISRVFQASSHSRHFWAKIKKLEAANNLDYRVIMSLSLSVCSMTSLIYMAIRLKRYDLAKVALTSFTNRHFPVGNSASSTATDVILLPDGEVLDVHMPDQISLAIGDEVEAEIVNK